MIERFTSDRKVLLDAILDQKLVHGEMKLAEMIVNVCELQAIEAGTALIEQGGSDNEVFLVLSGVFNVVVNGRIVAQRGPNDHVGEMAAIQPSQTRSASIVAVVDSVVCRISSTDFAAMAGSFSGIWRVIARELAKRLEQRNALVTKTRDRVQVFIISSIEALPLARAIQNAFEYDPFNVTVWTDGVFNASWYPVESLELQLDVSDFAIAIASPEDSVLSRGKSVVTTRDNVIFELGLFIGRLGRKRSILLEPQGEELTLPSDLTGLTTIRYQGTSQDKVANLAPACNKLRDIINDLGPNN